mmetsp:Transcript_5837/g.8171  ORF Transcript_5837/g.8171 Transcript_5837/m.8171 type:complete len:688 (-) Transcript_5837:33-2096(-)
MPDQNTTNILIVNLFHELNELKIPEEFAVKSNAKHKALGFMNKKEKSKEKLKDTFLPYVELLLTKFNDARVAVQQGLPNSNAIMSTTSLWPRIFSIRISEERDLLGDANYQHYMNVINTYMALQQEMEAKSNCPPTNTSTVALKTALDMLDYLTVHQDDPDNCLIGLTPSRAVLKSVQFDETADIDLFQKEPQTKEDFINLISSWSELKDDKMIADRVRKFTTFYKANVPHSTSSSNLHSLKPLKKGELLVCRFKVPAADANGTSTFKYLFGRNFDDKGATLRVCFDKYEQSDFKELSKKDIFAFNDAMKANLKELRLMDKMVRDPTHQLYDTVMDHINKRCDNYILEKNIFTSLDVTEQWKNNATITDLPTVKKTVAKLQALCANPAVDLYKEVDEYCNKLKMQFYEGVDSQAFFLPTKGQSLTQLERFLSQREGLVKQRLQRYLGICESTLDQLSIQMRDIANGNVKHELTDWWLKKIKERVDAFLKSHNFDHTAVPDNYIDNPPTSIAAVKSNLIVIQQILSAFNSMQKERSAPKINGMPVQLEEKSEKQKLLEKDLTLLMNDLKTEIYSVLDDFVQKVQIILGDQFDLLDDANCNPFDVTIVASLFKITQEDMDPKTAAWVERLVADVIYINTMKQLEDQTEKIEKKDIVPITGLIVGRFHRFENELQTVLEVWEPKTAVSNS